MADARAVFGGIVDQQARALTPTTETVLTDDQMARLDDEARARFEELLDQVTPAGTARDPAHELLREALRKDIALWTVALVADESEDLTAPPHPLVVESANRGALGPGADSGGAIRDGLLSSVFTVFENLPLPVMQGLVTTARVAGAVIR